MNQMKYISMSLNECLGTFESNGKRANFSSIEDFQSPDSRRKGSEWARQTSIEKKNRKGSLLQLERVGHEAQFESQDNSLEEVPNEPRSLKEIIFPSPNAVPKEYSSKPASLYKGNIIQEMEILAECDDNKVGGQQAFNPNPAPGMAFDFPLADSLAAKKALISAEKEVSFFKPGLYLTV